VSELHGQDIQFSQFYGSPLYLNPGFAGSSHNYRGIFHQRLQWPSIEAKYTTSLFSVDGYSNQYKSGLGLLFLKDNQGSNIISSTEAAIQYSYELHLSSHYTFRAGMQLGYASRTLNYANLTFPDQHDNLIGLTGNPSIDNMGSQTKGYVDFSPGGVFYSDNLFFGASAHHLNRPNQSIISGVSRLPTKYAFITGYKIPLIHKKHMAYLESEKDISITPTFHYKSQGKSDQLDFGVYGIYDMLMVAVWYRGIPVKHYERGLQNNESMVLLAGWSFNGIQIAYSYDFIVSKLRPAGTGGSHEITLVYVHQKHHKNAKIMKTLPCPSLQKKHSVHQHQQQHHEQHIEHKHQQFHH
jgi:type IX secretion system PorP/SprF family membrane protein